MLTLRVSKCLRLVAGFGLLLLLMAQQKLCPWLVSPSSKPQPGAATTASTNSEQDDAARKRESRRLPFLLPDTPAPAPRWASACSQVLLRHSTGWRDGVVSCGERSPSTGNSHAGQPVVADHWAWHRFLLPVEPRGLPQPPADVLTAIDPAVRTSISPTGPPVA